MRKIYAAIVVNLIVGERRCFKESLSEKWKLIFSRRNMLQGATCLGCLGSDGGESQGEAEHTGMAYHHL